MFLFLTPASGERSLREAGGGLRERVEGLLQEADRAAQHAHRLPPWLPQQGRAAEGDDAIIVVYSDRDRLFL